MRPPGPVRPPAFRPRASFRIGPRLELRRWRFGLRPFLRRYPRDLPPLLLPPPPPDAFVQPEGPGPSPLLEDAPEPVPLPHGFHLFVKVGAGRAFDAPSRLDRFVQVGQALGRCFRPPEGFAWGQVTLRVAFRRDGTVFGAPRVPYSDAGTADRKAELARSVLAGLNSCAPLPLSPSLGAAVAGEIFAITFIHEDER